MVNYKRNGKVLKIMIDYNETDFSALLIKKSLNVLIVDDEEIIRIFLSAAIKHAGGTVFEAENGSKALQIFDNNPIDIILMDLSMPEMDGFEAIRLIKNRSQTFIPIISINGFDDETILTRALAKGADDLLTKPVSPPILISKMNAMIRIKETIQQ